MHEASSIGDKIREVELDAAWVGVVGALGGVVVTALAGLVTAVLNHRWQTSSRHEDRSDRLREARAQLRRDAYARFLIAVQVMGEKIETRPPENLSQPLDERLNNFRLANAEQFREFDAAERYVRLLAGPSVIGPFDTYWTWIIEQTQLSFEAGSPANSKAFESWGDFEKPLIEAMRSEQETDLSIET
jgi:hypothetical protein